MLYCRVTGSTVATQKAEGLAGFKLLKPKESLAGE